MYLVHDMRVHRTPSCKWQGRGLLQGVADGLSGNSPGMKLWSQWCLQDEAHSLHSCEECPVVSVPHGVYIGFQLTVVSDKC